MMAFTCIVATPALALFSLHKACNARMAQQTEVTTNAVETPYVSHLRLLIVQVLGRIVDELITLAHFCVYICQLAHFRAILLAQIQSTFHNSRKIVFLY
jgi:hypothetical protein